jgi:hypothetical protein
VAAAVFPVVVAAFLGAGVASPEAAASEVEVASQEEVGVSPVVAFSRAAAASAGAWAAAGVDVAVGAEWPRMPNPGEGRIFLSKGSRTTPGLCLSSILGENFL